jgi:hypothetical protein
LDLLGLTNSRWREERSWSFCVGDGDCGQSKLTPDQRMVNDLESGEAELFLKGRLPPIYFPALER